MTSHELYAKPKIKRGLCKVGVCKGKIYAWNLCKHHLKKYYPDRKVGCGPGVKAKEINGQPWWKSANWKLSNTELAKQFGFTRNYVSVVRKTRTKQKAVFACKIKTSQ